MGGCSGARSVGTSSENIDTIYLPSRRLENMESGGEAYDALDKMGLGVSRVGEVEPVQERRHCRLFRITLDGSSYILKVFGDPQAAREVGAYGLLENLGVPILHTVARTNDALLLEDLEASTHLRLAREEDVGKTEVGAALAEWYRTLHHASSRLQPDQTKPSFLWREIEELTPASILEVALKVGGSDQSGWVTLADNIDRIKNAAITYGETLTHNDFHRTNLALSRNDNPIRAVVFDYDLLGLGLRYSDCRNVTGSLGPDAADAFRSAYGETDPREKILDDLTAPLYVLVEAFRRPRFPSWAEQSLKLAKTGELHKRLDRVMEVL